MMMASGHCNEGLPNINQFLFRICIHFRKLLTTYTDELSRVKI